MRTANIILLILGDLLLFLINFQLICSLNGFEIDATINILDFASLLVTIIIATFVPILIKKAIDDNRGIKEMLIEEIKDLLEILERNHNLISDLFSDGHEIKSNHRDTVRYNFYEAELKIDCLKLQLEVSYPKKSSIAKEAFDDYLKYKSFLTDGKFMISSNKNIDYDFYQQDNNKFAVLRKNLLISIHKIHKL